MINSEYIYFLVFVLSSRLPFYSTEQKLTVRELFIKLIIQLFPILFFSYKFNLILIVLALIAINVAEFILEEKQLKKGSSLNGLRTIEIVVTIIITSIIFSINSPMVLSDYISTTLKAVKNNYIIKQNILSFNSNTVGIIILGVLFLLNEVNLPIRSLLTRLKVLPKKGTGNTDKNELNAGRVIGMVERILVYIFVLGGEYAALGLILAAKAYARSKRMDDQDFAEYVLIGTLVSTAFALIIGLAVKYLIGF